MPSSWCIFFLTSCTFPCQLQETADYDPFLLFSANLKRDLAGEQPYHRALRESGLESAGAWEAGRLGLAT